MFYISQEGMVLHDEILVGDLSKFGIKYLTIECQPDKELEEMKAEWRHPNSVSQIISFQGFPFKTIFRGHCDPQVVDFGGHFQFERVTY